MKKIINNNHYPVGWVVGSCGVSFELILLHVKAVGGVLRE